MNTFDDEHMDLIFSDICNGATEVVILVDALKRLTDELPARGRFDAAQEKVSQLFALVDEAAESAKSMDVRINILRSAEEVLANIRGLEAEFSSGTTVSGLFNMALVRSVELENDCENLVYSPGCAA